MREPAPNFALGLTSVNLGVPDYAQALDQHHAYCDALTQSGLQVIKLPADDRYPDSTFVEDTAVVTERGAIITRPGATSRAGEVDSISRELSHLFAVQRITEPGTLDGGDVCEADEHFFIGISKRTNEAGARQLADYLAKLDYTSSLIDIRKLDSILHLKSGLAYLGKRRLAVIDALIDPREFEGYELFAVPAGEEYAANCLNINDRMYIAAGFPNFQERLKGLGYETIALQMSEFRKMDGGLSCLSIRF